MHENQLTQRSLKFHTDGAARILLLPRATRRNWPHIQGHHNFTPKIGHIYKSITISRKKLCTSVAPRMHNKLVQHRLIEEQNATIDLHKSRTQFNVRSDQLQAKRHFNRVKDYTEDRNVTTVGYHRQGWDASFLHSGSTEYKPWYRVQQTIKPCESPKST